MIIVAHPGSQHVPHLVRGLLRAGSDVTYHTTMMFGENIKFQRFLPSSLVGKRKLAGIPDRVINRQSLLEFIPALFRFSRYDDSTAYSFRNRLFQKNISSKALRGVTAIIGFDTSSLILAKRAREEGIPFFLELTTPHPREKQRWAQYIVDNFPGWPIDMLRKSEDLIDKEDQEVELATVVSVPAPFVRESHERYTGARSKYVINPFGADLAAFYPGQSNRSRPRFIFMGTLNAAKGIPVLLKAWEKISPHAELVIAGHGEFPPGIALPANVTVVGSIQKDARLAFFHSGDVLVCPSLYEGLAIVQVEAAACGLAVIGTHNSGGSAFLEHGKEGLFVEPGNVDALAEAIALLCKDASLRQAMGSAAAVKAKSYTWDAYTARWLDIISAHSKTGRT